MDREGGEGEGEGEGEGANLRHRQARQRGSVASKLAASKSSRAAVSVVSHAASWLATVFDRCVAYSGVMKIMMSALSSCRQAAM